MNTKKHLPNDKLRKSSKLFLQLGLVLALLTCYIVLEMSSVQKSLPILVGDNFDPDDTYVMPDLPDKIIIEPTVKPKKIIEFPKTPRILDNLVIKDNQTPTVVEVFKPEDNSGEIDNIINKLPKDVTDTPKDDGSIPFIILEEVPVFPGCENMSNKEAKACFTKQISKFVNKKFDTGLAEELGLSGKQQIFVQFVIDEEGMVKNIKAKAPHKSLEKEVLDIIKELPQMTPGKQRTKPVKVSYTLPIRFEIYN